MTEAAPPQDRTKATPIIDAAIRAGCQRYGILRHLKWDAKINCNGPFCECTISEVQMVALRTACPKEPPAEWLWAMAEAIACNRMAGGAEKSHVRWMLLFSDAMRCSYRMDAVAAYRAQPLWQELWGEP